MAKKSLIDPRSSYARQRKAARAVRLLAPSTQTDGAIGAEQSERPPEHFLAAWIEVLKRKRGEVADAAGISRAYMTNLCNDLGEDAKGPSAFVMLKISRVLGVTVNDLYERPPTRAETESLRRFQPNTVQVLRLAGVL